MSNTWIVVPVIDNSVDLTEFINKLSGGYAIPETYTGRVLNEESGMFEPGEIGHPNFGKTPPNFTNKIIFINTKSAYTEYPGISHIEDFGDINIYRCWNKGIESAILNGADSIVLLNTAIDFDLSVIEEAYDLMVNENKEVVNISDGAIVMISASSNIRADEQFQIWFGDNDLYKIAENVSTSIRVPYIAASNIINHVEDETFRTIVLNDELKYNSKWN